MSSFSRSSRGRNYKSGNHGSNHYKKKGLFGDLFEGFGSGSGRRNHNNQNVYETQNLPRNQQAVTNQPINNQNTIVCSSCNSQIPTGSKFCLQCGQKVNISPFCTNCGEKLPPGAKFCLSCGTKVN